jgi:hypothetical protein
MNIHPSHRRSTPALLIACCFLALPLAAGPPAAAPAYQLNDQVESNLSVFGWQKGTITEIGKGDHEGHIKIHTDGYDNWVRLPNQFVRKLAGASPAKVPAAGATEPPRLSRYLIMSHGAPSTRPLHLGIFELLPGGKYRLFDMGGTATGDGRYEFNGQTKQVRWISGPFLVNKWGGNFEISREGKTHEIRFSRSTIGINSTDSKF